MDLTAATKRRTQAGWIAAGLCLLMTLAVLDGLLARFRQPLNVFHLLPGQMEDIHGPLPEKADSLGDLRFAPSSPEIALEFRSQEKGFWLGTPLWRGQLRVGDRISPGDYQVRVFAGSGGPQPASPVFLIRVYPDPMSLQKSAPSLIRRILGLSPWWLVVFLLPWTVLAFGVIFMLSSRRDRLLLQEGKAEIYRVRRNEAGQEVAFGMGTADGIREGEVLELLDDRGRPLGVVRVITVDDRDAVAQAGPEQPLRPGYWVGRKH